MTGKAKTFKFGIKGAENQRGGSGSRYTGPIPPSGTYRCKIGRMGVKDNRKGDKMLYGVAEINDKEHPEYQGYGFWFQQNITNQSAGYINDLLAALVPESEENRIIKEFWRDGLSCVPDDKGFMHVKRIGSFKINSPDTEIEIMIAASLRKSQQWGDKLEARGYARIASQFAAVSTDEEEWDDEEDDSGTSGTGSSSVRSDSRQAEVEEADDYTVDDEDDDEYPDGDQGSLPF